jgi:ATP-binding cassette subfamily F protein uup
MLVQRDGRDLSVERGGGAKTEASGTFADAGGRSDSGGGQAAAVASVPKRKLSFKERHALETLPTSIAALEAEVATLSAALSDNGLAVRDAKGYAALTQKLGAAQAKLTAAEDQWLELAAADGA